MFLLNFNFLMSLFKENWTIDAYGLCFKWFSIWFVELNFKGITIAPLNPNFLHEKNIRNFIFKFIKSPIMVPIRLAIRFLIHYRTHLKVWAWNLYKVPSISCFMWMPVNYIISINQISYFATTFTLSVILLSIIFCVFLGFAMFRIGLFFSQLF